MGHSPTDSRVFNVSSKRRNRAKIRPVFVTVNSKVNKRRKRSGFSGFFLQ